MADNKDVFLEDLLSQDESPEELQKRIELLEALYDAQLKSLESEESNGQELKESRAKEPLKTTFRNIDPSSPFGTMFNNYVETRRAEGASSGEIASETAKNLAQAIDVGTGAAPLRYAAGKAMGADIDLKKAALEGVPSGSELVESSGVAKDSPATQGTLASVLDFLDPGMVAGLLGVGAKVASKSLGKKAVKELAESSVDDATRKLMQETAPQISKLPPVAGEKESLIERIKYLAQKRKELKAQKVEDIPATSKLQTEQFEDMKPVTEAELDPKSKEYKDLQNRPKMAKKLYEDMLNAVRKEEYGGRMDEGAYFDARQRARNAVRTASNNDPEAFKMINNPKLKDSARQERLKKIGRNISDMRDKAPEWVKNEDTVIPASFLSPEEQEMEYAKRLRESLNPPKDPSTIKLNPEGEELKLIQEPLQFEQLRRRLRK